MSCADDTEWGLEQIEATKALITAYNAAILALATGAQSYSLDTGQTRQTVTKQQLGSLRIVRAELMNELSTLKATYCRTGQVIVRPGF